VRRRRELGAFVSNTYVSNPLTCLPTAVAVRKQVPRSGFRCCHTAPQSRHCGRRPRTRPGATPPAAPGPTPRPPRRRRRKCQRRDRTRSRRCRPRRGRRKNHVRHPLRQIRPSTPQRRRLGGVEPPRPQPQQQHPAPKRSRRSVVVGRAGARGQLAQCQQRTLHGATPRRVRSQYSPEARRRRRRSSRRSAGPAARLQRLRAGRQQTRQRAPLRPAPCRRPSRLLTRCLLRSQVLMSLAHFSLTIRTLG